MGWVNHHTLKYAFRALALAERGIQLHAMYTHAPYQRGLDWKAVSGPFVTVTLTPEAPWPVDNDRSQEY